MARPLTICRHLLRRPTTPRLATTQPVVHASSTTAPFSVLTSQQEPLLLSDDDTSKRNRDANLLKFAELRAMRSAVENSDEEVRSKDRESRKLTVNERIDLLRDPGSDVFDVGLLAGWEMPYGRVMNASNAVVVTKIAGETCLVLANVWTFKGGTLYPISVKKQLRAQEISMENRIPCIYLVDSGGAFLPLQAEVFPDRFHGGRVFRNQANLSAMGIPQISVVCGPCTAGGAYVPTMSDEAVIVKGIGSLYLAGPPLVQAATGEKISTEDLGGASVHCGISGCTDHYVETEEEGCEVTRRIVSSLNLSERRQNIERSEIEDPVYSHTEEAFASLLPPDLSTGQWPALEVIARIVDGSRFHPFKERFGPTLHTGFARIHSRLVGIVASDGELTAAAAIKGTHFIRLCTFRDVPIVVFQNTPSDPEFLTSGGGNEGLVVKARAQMMSAMTCATVPKITVVVGGSFGPSSFAMGGRAMQPNFHISWAGAQLAIASPEDQLEILKHQSFCSDTGVDLLQRLKNEATIHPPSNLVTDAVILPHETRKILSQALDICTVYRQPPPPHPHRLNVLRM